MKKLFILLFILYCSFSDAQTIQQATLTQTENGANLQLNVYCSTLIGYLSHNYSISNNTIELNVCYWYTMFFAISNLENNFAIPLPVDPANYTITININNSISTQVCDFYEFTDTLSFDFSTPLNEPIVLSTNSFENGKQSFVIVPNPSNGIVTLHSDFDVEYITIVDHLGRLVKKMNYTGNKDLDLSHLQKGIYFIKLSKGNLEFTQKLILN